VADHYCHFFTVEQDAYDAAVTDWERKRYFEQI
jgi:glutamine synthetase